MERGARSPWFTHDPEIEMAPRNLLIALSSVLVISVAGVGTSACKGEAPAAEATPAEGAPAAVAPVPATDPAAPGEDPSPPVPKPASTAAAAAAAVAVTATGKAAAGAAPAGVPAIAPVKPPSAVAPPAPAAPVEDDRGRLVTIAAKGSPEWVVQQVLISAMTADADAGWKIIEPLMHSMHRTPNGMASYRSLNYPASRRKVHLFLEDDTKPHYRVARVETKEADVMKIFVFNERSMPTPCAVKKDTEAGGAWRIYRCSL